MVRCTRFLSALHLAPPTSARSFTSYLPCIPLHTLFTLYTHTYPVYPCILLRTLFTACLLATYHSLLHPILKSPLLYLNDHLPRLRGSIASNRFNTNTKTRLVRPLRQRKEFCQAVLHFLCLLGAKAIG